jgi:hypothetical protein
MYETESSLFTEEYRNGIQFTNNLSGFEGKTVLVIGKVVSQKHHNLYLQISDNQNKEIMVQNFKGHIPEHKMITIMGRVGTADDLEFITSFNSGFENFELWEEMQKFHTLYSNKHDVLSKFV